MTACLYTLHAHPPAQPKASRPGRHCFEPVLKTPQSCASRQQQNSHTAHAAHGVAYSTADSSGLTAVQQPQNCTAAGGGAGGYSNNHRRLTDADDGGNSIGSDSSTWLQLQKLSLWLALLLPAVVTLALPAPAAARSQVATKIHDKMLPVWEIDAFVERMWDLSGPILNNMGFSGLLGTCAAAAFKFVGRTLAASLGIGLILIQVLAHYNLITVNWSVVHQQAREVLDRTGDGRLDQDDFKRWTKQGLIILSEGVPSTTGFLIGFLLGLKLF
eukprot:GHRR01002760.1.p1 GENE.GHRR01002760.1~~GHRR01002760.1.p1  ORF type:complete len:272 (+),score=79.11 GHRR01002760.1:247-1062(+)